MAPDFLKRFLVELGHVQKLVELMRGHFNAVLKIVCCRRFRVQLLQSTVTDGV